MKIRYTLLTLLFAALSTTLFAQIPPQHFPQEQSLLNSHLHRSDKNHEFISPHKGDVDRFDEFHKQGLNPNAILPKVKLQGNTKNNNDIQYLCDSTFGYTISDEITKTKYIRDASGRLLSKLLQNWNPENAMWVNDYQYHYSYDGSGNNITYITQYWYAGPDDWVNHLKYNHTYDASGNLLSMIYQEYYTGSNKWFNKRKYSYTYDNSEYLILKMDQKWDDGNNSWLDDWGNSYTYDASGNLLSDISKIMFTGIVNGVNFHKDSFTYDASGNMLTYLFQSWQREAGIWVNQLKQDFTYDDSGNMLTSVSQNWRSKNRNWIYSQKISYTYDASGNELSYLIQGWESQSGNWANRRRYSHTYDDSGNKLSDLYEDWYKPLGFWSSKEKIDYEYDSKKASGSYYKWSSGWQFADINADSKINNQLELYIFNNLLFQSTDINKAEAFYSSYSLGIEDKDFQSNGNTSFCSPNPAKDLVNVTNFFSKEASLKIYTMNGQLLNEKLLSSGQNQVSIQNLAPGIYLFVLQSENSRIQNKVVVY